MAGRHSAVKSQPRKLRGPGAFMLPAHAISTKNKHLLVIYSIPARGFTAAVSVFGGTPPAKPLKCKFVLLFPAMRFPARGHTTSVTIQSSSSPNSICRQKTSSRCRAIHVHRLFVSFVDCHSLHQFRRENKKPCLHAVSRVKKFYFDSLPAYLQITQIRFGALPAIRPG